MGSQGTYTKFSTKKSPLFSKKRGPTFKKFSKRPISNHKPTQTANLQKQNFPNNLPQAAKLPSNTNSRQSKKDSEHSAVFLGEGIFTMGLVKTIYNVLGGFYMDYNSTNSAESVHKLNKSLHLFLCTFSSPISILSIFRKNMHKKTEFFRLGFVFVNFRRLLYIL